MNDNKHVQLQISDELQHRPWSRYSWSLELDSHDSTRHARFKEYLVHTIHRKFGQQTAIIESVAVLGPVI
jgi:hypothetical protein